MSTRLFALSERKFAAFITAMRLFGGGSQGRAEALAIFHPLIIDEWQAGAIAGPLARIKVDEKHCFAMSGDR